MDTHIDFMRGPLLHLLYAGALTINADKSTHEAGALGKNKTLISCALPARAFSYLVIVNPQAYCWYCPPRHG
jgi:hypothetical protein